MASSNSVEIMQVCRLCLVKEQVNVPIFEDPRQVLEKISACLPVKVSQQDKLPKKICNSCLYKLELQYQFWNTTTNAEKQLLAWLRSGVNSKSNENLNMTSTCSITLKEEPNCESNDVLSTDSQGYVLEQQQLQYGDEFQFGEEEIEEDTVERIEIVQTNEPPAKRPRRNLSKRTVVMQQDSEEEMDDALGSITKTEEESEEEEEEEEHEHDEQYDDSQDGEQPGPSGIGRVSTEAPYEETIVIENDIDSTYLASYQCEVCSQVFADRKEFIEHHMSQFGSTFTCCRCAESFRNSTELYQHYERHKVENEMMLKDMEYQEEEIIEEDEEAVELHYSENVEAVMNIPGASNISGNNDLLYILDDNQCVNEVVIEDAEQARNAQAQKHAENYTIVQVDHGYVIPSVFKGQLEAKRRYKKKDAHSVFLSAEDEAATATNILVKMEPGTSKSFNISPKLKVQPPKRRHEIPDFSAANYQILKPTEEVDMPHYKCLRCEQLFISKFVFFRHIEKGKCYVNSCDVCTTTFDKNSEFYEHYVAEHTERAICNFCFRTFMYEKNVKEHMLRHLDQFRHRCEECNKGFYTVREYRNHYKNRHMGIRHKCDECGRSFADEYYFKRHLATHGLKLNQTL